MPEGRQPFGPHLSLVTADNRPPSGDQIDWSTRMALAQGGDREQYRALLKEIEPYVRSIAGRCFKHPADAEDALQDVLLTVHSIRHTYDPRRPFAPWLTAIANRRIIDRLRSETRKKAREIELSGEHKGLSHQAFAHETFLQAATNHDGIAERALHEAIGRLPPEQRDAITMLKLNEMSLKEASRMSGRSIAALKVATHRALANLRKLLRGDQAS
jgi:RNA polymerase sigma-70 factor, ECF subfamily